MSKLHSIKVKLSRPYKLPLGGSNVRFLSELMKVWFRHARVIAGGYDPLTALATKYGTDKGKTVYPFHGYTRQYHKIFEKFRREQIKLLEIGLARTTYRGDAQHTCPSLGLWLEYFEKAEVFGFDIDDFTHVNLPRTTVLRGDQGNRDDLLMVADRGQSFDIIIDDGSHASYHQQITLETLFPYLRNGGVYVIEDLHHQPEGLEAALPCKRKTKEILNDRPYLESILDGVGSIRYFDSELLGGEGEMCVIEKV